jgi:acetolactate synthase small subunit
MTEEVYPKTNITIAANGLQVEIQASESVTVKSSISSSDSINLAVMIIANRLQVVDQLQDQLHQMQQVLQVIAANDGSNLVHEAVDES